MALKYKFVIIGAGNLGTRLGIALSSSGHTALKIINRSKGKAKLLADKLNCEFGSDLVVPKEADIVFISTGDDDISSVISKVNSTKAVWVHVSGSTDIEVFKPYIENYGVFYPMQSFTAKVEVDFKTIPILLEASNDKAYACLKELADSLSENVLQKNSIERLKCHLAAVFAINFGNHFMALAEDILKETNCSPEFLYPLIDEMVFKIKNIGAKEAQTGPARRNDRNIIKKHQEILKSNPSLQNLYTFVSDSIVKFYEKK